MIVAYMCVFFYSFFKTFHRRNQNPESRSLSLRRKRSFCAAHEKEDFLLPFASLLSTKIIHQIKSLQNVFHLCHSCRRFCVQREQGMRFCSRRSLSVFLFLLSLPRSASLCEGLWLRCFSLSLSAGESQVAKVWIVIARSFTRPLYLSFFARVSSRQRQRRISPFLVYSLFSTK